MIKQTVGDKFLETYNPILKCLSESDIVGTFLVLIAPLMENMSQVRFELGMTITTPFLNNQARPN